MFRFKQVERGVGTLSFLYKLPVFFTIPRSSSRNSHNIQVSSILTEITRDGYFAIQLNNIFIREVKAGGTKARATSAKFRIDFNCFIQLSPSPKS